MQKSQMRAWFNINELKYETAKGIYKNYICNVRKRCKRFWHITIIVFDIISFIESVSVVKYIFMFIRRPQDFWRLTPGRRTNQHIELLNTCNQMEQSWQSNGFFVRVYIANVLIWRGNFPFNKFHFLQRCNTFLCIDVPQTMIVSSVRSA